jgi:hypothetical protein
VFRACHNRYRECVSAPVWPRAEIVPPPQGCGKPTFHRRYGLKQVEFAADFWNVARREFKGKPELWEVFRLYFLAGRSWRECCPAVGKSRGDFFHAVYVVEQRLGKAYAELKPYGLFPLDEYFGGRRARVQAIMPPQPRRALRLFSSARAA